MKLSFLIIKSCILFLKAEGIFLYYQSLLCQKDFEYADYTQCREVPPQRGCPGYDTELHLMVRLQFWSTEECWVLPHCHYLQAHTDNGQIQLLKNYFILFNSTMCTPHPRNLNTKNIDMNIQWMQLPNPRQVGLCLQNQSISHLLAPIFKDLLFIFADIKIKD